MSFIHLSFFFFAFFTPRKFFGSLIPSPLTQSLGRSLGFSPCGIRKPRAQSHNVRRQERFRADTQEHYVYYLLSLKCGQRREESPQYSRRATWARQWSLGVIATGLSGEYSWAVVLWNRGVSARIGFAPAPASPTAEELAQAVVYIAEHGDDD